jgi:single-strand DNA-binding protein
MYQCITILGNLGRDPELRFTPNGSAVCQFSVAASRRYKKGDELTEETTWFRVSAWGKMAEACNSYLHKGSKVLVVGRLVPDPTTGGPRIWTSESGAAKASFEINASEVRFLDAKGDKKQEAEKEFPF